MAYTTAFTSLANIRLASPSRILPASCCPDKDLVILLSRLGGVDRMSLWHSTQGTRVWEVDIGTGEMSHVVGIAWSPDGQTIAVACDPPSISFHSIQDGHSFLSLPIRAEPGQPFNLTGVWWFRDESKAKTKSVIPDIFRRGDVITGSAHSVFKLLPLLDHLEEDSDKLTATDVFAFQGSHTRSNPKNRLPSVINSWPTLSMTATSGSVGASSHTKSSEGSNLDEVDTSNVDSLLLASDDLGRIYVYLDGTFPLGSVDSEQLVSFSSFSKHPSEYVLLGQTSMWEGDKLRTSIRPTVIDFPLLSQKKSRELAKLSTTARELVWYSMRVTQQMKEAWLGSESNTGARELGPRWIQSLMNKQRQQFGLVDPNPILDLTTLLTTGRASESLTDFLGSAEQMSERGLQKWETTLSEALIKLRDFSEKRLAPAYQRLHLVLGELKGWSRLSQYGVFELSGDEIMVCLDLAGRGIMIASWLAAVSRRELSRFKEFMQWLRHEVNNINSQSEGNVPKYDTLEVFKYFEEGLRGSVIDRWFSGPVPGFSLADLGISNQSLEETLEQCRRAISDRWMMPSKPVGEPERNLEALVGHLAERCQRIFAHAGGAASRTAGLKMERDGIGELCDDVFRERTVMNEAGEAVQHLVACRGSSLLVLRLDIRDGRPHEIGSALLVCSVDDLDLELLAADFFDDEYVAVVFMLKDELHIGLVGYGDVEYEVLEESGRDALGSLWNRAGRPVGIERRRAIGGIGGGGSIGLAVNGRTGRRVGCILDSAGTFLSCIDLEEDGE